MEADFTMGKGGLPLAIGGVRIGTPNVNSDVKNLCYSTFCALLCALSFGYVIGYSSPALPAMIKDGTLDETAASWFGSLMPVGAMLGCPIAGWLVEAYGRKAALMSTSIPYMLGWVGIMNGHAIYLLLFARFLTGIASGMTTVVAPMYVAETSSKELRGMFGSGVQLSITLGIFLVYALGGYMTWPMLALVGIIIPIAALILIYQIPETPRYYLLKNRKMDAIKSLTWLRGPHADVEDELRDIEESMDVDDKVKWSELWEKAELWQPLKVAMGLMLFQQLSGINAVMFYTVAIFESAGFKENGAQATMVIGAVQVVFTFAACLLMDRAGRRLLLLVASIGMALSCISMGYYYHITESATENNIAWLALASLVAYIIAFSLGWGPIPMLVTSEIFPVRARGTAASLATSVSWLSGFIITKQFSSWQAALGMAGTFWMFGICCLIGLLFVWKKVPETKGKSLEDIELYFLGRAVRGI